MFACMYVCMYMCMYVCMYVVVSGLHSKRETMRSSPTSDVWCLSAVNTMPPVHPAENGYQVLAISPISKL